MSLNNVYQTNRMLYKFQQPRSVKLEPTDILQQPFDDQTYKSGSTMTTSLTTGKHFVCPEKSYVNLQVRVDAPEQDIDETGQITYNTSSQTTTTLNETGVNLQELLDFVNASVGSVVEFTYDEEQERVKHTIKINSTSVVKISSVVGDTGLYRLLGYYAPGSTIDLGQNIGDIGFGNIYPVVSPLRCDFGLGSCQNLWNSIRINHKSGTQIANVQNLDKWVKSKAYLEKDDFWFDTYGFIQGFRDAGADPIWHSAGDETRSFKLKLCELHPFFKGTDYKLFPPEVIDSLRIELDLNPKNRVFSSAGDIHDYEVTSCDMQLALVLVQDEAVDIISDEANAKGLEWTYNDVFITTKQVESIEDNFTVAVDKAVSLAKNVISFASFTLGNTQSQVDAYDYRPMPSAKWNYRIHNKLYPYQRRISNKFDSYTTAVDMTKWECGHNLTYAEWDDHNALYVSGLMSDDHIKNAGIYLNSNKKVELDFEKANDGNSRLIHTCLEFTKRLSVNTVNSKIDV